MGRPAGCHKFSRLAQKISSGSKSTWPPSRRTDVPGSASKKTLCRVARQERLRQAAEQGARLPMEPGFNLKCCQFQDFAWEARSLDLAVADYPWQQADLCENIGRIAARALKPGKLLLLSRCPENVRGRTSAVSAFGLLHPPLVINYFSGRCFTLRHLGRKNMYCPVLLCSNENTSRRRTFITMLI